jgi:parvulin-like peptidyl-prolyl isomerase
MAAILAGGVLPAAAELANGVQAVVDDSAITIHEFNSLNEQTYDALLRRYQGDPQEFEKKVNQTRAENLEKLVDWKLVLHEFKTAGYSLPESLLDDLVQERIRTRFHDPTTFAKTLQEEGMTREKYRQQIREQFIVEQLRAKNISQEIIISPHKVEAYYLAHREEFKVEDEVKLRMIVLNKTDNTNSPPAHALAEEILAQIKAGTPFAEMASVYSQESKRSQGGDWDWVERSVLRKELSDAAFSLKPGDCSSVIDTGNACYILRVEDKRPAHFKSLTDVRGQIERSLLLEEQGRLEKQWMEKLKRKTYVRYF